MSAREQAVLEVSVAGVDKAASQFTSFQQTTTKTMSASEAAVARSLNNMVSQFAGVAAAARAVKAVVSAGIGFDRFVEDTTTSFTVMMKSAEKAKAQMKSLYDFAVSSPLTFKETAASSKQLMAYGFAAKELIPTMKTLGSVAIATGHSLDDIAYVYGTLKSQGRAYSRDLMQFGMRGIPIYDELAKVLGVNVDQIQKMASEGKIGFAEVETAFKNMTTNGGRFAGILDSYMTTLTGKLSMLTDIATQTAGSLMAPTTKVLTEFVDTLTKQFQDTGFQRWISSVANDIGMLAQVLSTTLSIVVKLLPVLTAFVKLWIAFKGLQLVGTVLSSIPNILLSISSAMALGSAVLVGYTASMTTYFTGLASALATIQLKLAVLIADISVFIAANPWILALVGVTAAVGIAAGGMYKEAEKRRTSTNENVRAQELERKFTLLGAARRQTASDTSAWVTADEVAAIAKQYNLAEGTTAKILMNTGAMNKDSWNQYINTKSANMALEEQAKIAEGLRHVSLTMEQEQMQFLSDLTGQSASTYEDLTNIDLNALGNKGAQDYIAGFADQRKEAQRIFGEAFTPEMNEDMLKKEAKGITEALVAGAQVRGLFDTNYDETLRTRLIEVNKEIDTLGKKAKELPKLDTWWTPLVQAAKRTLTPLDDIEVSTAKTMEAAQKEYDARMEIYKTQLKELTDQKTRSDLILLRNKDTERYLQLLKDITAEGIKQKNLALYNQTLSGNDQYWENMKAKAGEKYQNAANISNIGGFYAQNAMGAFSTGDFSSFFSDISNAVKYGFESIKASGAKEQFTTQMLQGTEIGNIQSGGMGVASVVSQAVLAFTEMISSIENVSKVLYPFKTLFDSAKVIIEPLLNNALKPLVQILTQLGTVVGQMLAPFIGIIKMLSVLIYVSLIPLMPILNLVGAAFEWLYNYAIVPFGNGIIFVANGFIGMVNSVINALNNLLGWTGFHINQIEYIDKLQTTTEALQSLTDTINNQKDALTQTIDYLTNKINDAIDDQIDSYQDLYDVGAITAADYESQVKALNSQKISSDAILVSTKDMALTGSAIYTRLAELYAVKDAVENNKNLSEEEIGALLTKYGLTSTSTETAMYNGVLAALKAYNAAPGSSTTVTASTPTVSVPGTLSEATESAISSVVAASSATGWEAFSSSTGTQLNQDSSFIKAWHAFMKGDYTGLTSTEKHLLDQYTYAYDTAKRAAYGNLPYEAYKLKGFSSGTSNVPYDMTANIHKGEGIVPSTFMNSIRSGELVLSSGKNEGSGQSIVVYVNVEGSVQTETDLATSIANKMYTLKRSHNLTTA